MKQGFVYILTNRHRNVLYVGVTSDLKKRIYEHKQGLRKGFSKKYQLHYLVYYESADCIESAIRREKQLKSGSRKNKIKLITHTNPLWNDLSLTL